MKAATNIEVRQNNRRRLLKLLFENGEMVKQDMANQLNMSLSTVNYLVKELIEGGLLTTGALLSSTGGRKPVCIKPVYDSKFSVGVETTSDRVRIVALDLGAHIIAKESHQLIPENSASYWNKVGELIQNFGTSYHIPKERLLDVGITLGITMQEERIVARKLQNQEFLFDIELARKNIGLPVHFRHGTKMAAVAQCRHSGPEKNFVYIYLGAKISGAIIFDGAVMDFSGINGEFGCMLALHTADRIRVDSIFSRKILCSQTGCKDLDELSERLKKGDSQCTSIWKTYINELAKLIHNIYCIFGWPIVIGGSVSPYIINELPTLEAKVRQDYPFEEFPEHMLSVSTLGEYGSAVGAALLSLNRFFDNII